MFTKHGLCGCRYATDSFRVGMYCFVLSMIMLSNSRSYFHGNYLSPLVRSGAFLLFR